LPAIGDGTSGEFFGSERSSLLPTASTIPSAATLPATVNVLTG
jgi:hypothetical protein